MAEKSYDLEFDGYWRAPNIAGLLPEHSGIYCVYACIHHPDRNTVSLNRLLYIGEAANVRERVTGHEKWNVWRRELRSGEELCFNDALISPAADRQRAEAAMIYRHKPPCNTDFVDSFPYDKTTISTSGRNALLESYFTVFPTGSLAGLLFGSTLRSR